MEGTESSYQDLEENKKDFTENNSKYVDIQLDNDELKLVRNDLCNDDLERNKRNFNVLRKIKMNCLHYSIYHNKRYHYYKRLMIFGFRLPIIILSAFNSLEQNIVSISNALVSLVCGILTSVELLLGLQKKMEIEIDTYKSYYKLGMDIYKFIEDKNKTSEEINIFLQEVYERYQNIVNISVPINIFRLGFKDELCKDDEIERQLLRQASQMNQQLDNRCNKYCLCDL